MRRVLQSLASLGAVILFVLLSSGSAHAAAVGHVDIAINSDARIANYGYTADHEQVVILQAWETTELRALKAANPNVKVLMYQNASSASTSAAADGLYPTGVSYTQAASNGWLLKNTSGQHFTFEDENWLYATNVGSASYQNAWASNVIHELKSAPWSGVFIDDLNPTIEYHYPVNKVAKYPSNATYSAAMGSFAHLVGNRIRAAGKLAIANIGSWSSYGSTVDPWLKSLSGGMDEEFVKWGTTAASGYANEATWRQQLNEVSLTASEHKLFIGVTHSSAGDEHAAVYGYATELLAGRGKAIFSMNSTYSSATWFAPYNYNIGTPTGHYTVSKSGVYERSFTGGRDLVNPTSAPRTVALGGSYSGCGLASVKSVTLRPNSAVVLTAA